MLSGSNLVVLSLIGNSELPQLLVEILHELADILTDNSEIVILHLLPLGRHCTEESSSGEDDVLTLHGLVPVDKEIFLLRSNGYVDLGSSGISK